MAELFETLMYPSEDGQIKTQEQKNRTVEIDSGEIGTTDFATPQLDFDRNRKFMSEHKREMTRKAYVETYNKFGGNVKVEEVKWNPYE